jgi:hypothetical protein
MNGDKPTSDPIPSTEASASVLGAVPLTAATLTPRGQMANLGS